MEKSSVGPQGTAVLERLLASSTNTPLTAVILVSDWHLGSRTVWLEKVEAAARKWGKTCDRVLIVGYRASVSTLRRLGAGEVIVRPSHPRGLLPAFSAALAASQTELNLFVGIDTESEPGLIPALCAGLQEPDSAVAARLHPTLGLQELPLLCRRPVRPLISALLALGQNSVPDLLRRPCARLIPI